MSKDHRNFGLDLMRATAILLVIFGHYFATTPLGLGGYCGVEIFFVLSGFLIGNLLIRSFQTRGPTVATLRSFWLKRWFRTLPNYYFFFLFHSLIVLAMTHQIEPNAHLYLVFLQNFTRPIEDFFSESWSLAVEEWFYLLFPLLIVLVNPGTKLRHGALFAITALFLLVPLLLRAEASFFWDSFTIRRIVIFRLDTMMFGVLTAMVMNWQARLWARLTHPGFLGLALMVFLCGLALFHDPTRLATVFCFPVTALGAALALPFLYRLERWTFAAPVVEYVSQVSYSTYLVHMPFLVAVESCIGWGPPGVVKLAMRLAMVVAVLLLSYLPYRWIETPFLHMRDRVLKK